MLSLKPDELHIWLCHSGKYRPEDAMWSDISGVLDPHEQARMQRFKFERHARHFCLSHLMVRHVLSQYAELEPADWVYTKNEFGKPFVSNKGFEHLQFSLSHTKDLIALAVTEHLHIGCDVEWHSSRVRCSDVAHRFFAAAEEQELKSLAEADQRQRFFDFWALKESYIKAKGRGLAIGLGRFAFSLQDRPVGFSSDPELNDSASDWNFALFDVGKGHSGAFAYPGADCTASFFEYQPGSPSNAFQPRENSFR